MTQTHSAQPGIRAATPDEFDACLFLLVRLATPDLFTAAKEALATLAAADPGEILDPFVPVVATNFREVGEQVIVLVPPGRHDIPASFFDAPRLLVGLPGRTSICGPGNAVVREKPVVHLVEAGQEDFANLDTLQVAPIAIIRAPFSRFGNLSLDAVEPTVIELFLDDGEMLGDRLADCDVGEAVEMVDARAATLEWGGSGRWKPMASRAADGLASWKAASTPCTALASVPSTWFSAP